MFANNAYAMAGGAEQQAGGGMEGIIMLVIMFAIFYLLLIRPQQKRAKQHKELVENLKSGDQVVTAGGIHGKIVAVQDDAADPMGIWMLQFTDGTHVEFVSPAARRRLKAAAGGRKAVRRRQVPEAQLALNVA